MTLIEMTVISGSTLLVAGLALGAYHKTRKYLTINKNRSKVLSWCELHVRTRSFWFWLGVGMLVTEFMLVISHLALHLAIFGGVAAGVHLWKRFASK